MRVEEFVDLVATKCKQHKIEFVADEKIVMDDMEVNGYFCNEEMVLKSSTSTEKWFETLAHEYCHMLQFLDNYEPFMQYSSVSDGFWGVLEGKEIDIKSKDIIQLVEYDCERRVLELVDELDLPIDKKEYAKRANAYVYFYDVIARCGKWYDIGNEPYNNKAIIKQMPDTLDNNYKNVSEDILIMIEKELFDG